MRNILHCSGLKVYERAAIEQSATTSFFHFSGFRQLPELSFNSFRLLSNTSTMDLIFSAVLCTQLTELQHRLVCSRLLHYNRYLEPWMMSCRFLKFSSKKILVQSASGFLIFNRKLIAGVIYLSCKHQLACNIPIYKATVTAGPESSDICTSQSSTRIRP